MKKKRYPEIARLIGELKSLLPLREIVDKVCPGNMSRFWSWFYGRSCPTPKECACISVLRSRIEGNDPKINMRQLIEATTKTSVSRRGVVTLFDDAQIEQLLVEASAVVHVNQLKSEPLTQADSVLLLKFGRLLPQDMQPVIALVICKMIEEVVAKTRIGSEDPRMVAFVGATLNCFCKKNNTVI